MVYTRRRRVVKTKRRPLMRKRRMNISRPVLRQGKLYKFKRTCQLASWYFDGTNWVQQGNNIISNDNTYPAYSGIYKFRLEDLPNPTDFTQLYEQFKITGVKLKFIPFVGTESSSSTSVFTETMALAIDRGANDLSVVNPTFNSLLENQDVKLRNSQRPFSLWIGTPTYHQPADGLAQGSYRSGWLDSEINSARNVDFHGVKWAFPTNRSSVTSCLFRVFATYYIVCRNPQ